MDASAERATTSTDGARKARFLEFVRQNARGGVVVMPGTGGSEFQGEPIPQDWWTEAMLQVNGEQSG